MNRELLQNSINTQVVMTFSRSSGSGGQNVNKVNTKVTAVLALDNIEGLSVIEDELLRKKLSGRINEKGALVIQVQDERSQFRNRQLAVERLLMLIEEAVKIPRKRKPTRPGRGARENRLQSKKHRKEKKALRKPVSFGD